jgi:putative hydrolase of the HAD superfamily
MILVFDLDDTLYDEITFVHSGFNAVAKFLFEQYALPQKSLFKAMVKVLEVKGRGEVFNSILHENGIYSKALVKRCITIYRHHHPEIKLPQESINCIRRFKDTHKYIVTDGNKIAQYNKIKALGVESYFKKVFVTHRYGIKNAKPSVYCFEKIRAIEKCEPNEVVYIADNPNKDFVNIKKMGYLTVRILKGGFADQQFPAEYDAHCSIRSLDELTEEFLSKQFKT